MTAASIVRFGIAEGVATVTLARPDRHNSLVPELLAALNAALDAARAADPRVLVLAAEGRSFSTGGDVAAFAAEPRGARRAYAAGLVGALNEAILRVVDFPAPVITRLNGLVTGGSCGLVFASDIVVMAETAFLQPYYTEVGFAPDGGWTALLPERIGAARAGAIQFANRRIRSGEALALGLATEVVPADGLDAAVARWTGSITTKVGASVAATRRLLWPAERRTRLEEGLERERQAFLGLIETDVVEDGMRRFLEALT